jgi:hypothetical protein
LLRNPLKKKGGQSPPRAVAPRKKKKKLGYLFHVTADSVFYSWRREKQQTYGRHELCSAETIIVYEEYGLVGYNAMQFRDSPTFRRNISLPSLGSKSKPSKKPAEAGHKLGWFFARFTFQP